MQAHSVIVSMFAFRRTADTGHLPAYAPVRFVNPQRRYIGLPRPTLTL